jgi:hypothetical protein
VISSVPSLYVAKTTDIDNSLITSPLPHFLSTFLLNYLPSGYKVDAAVHYAILQQFVLKDKGRFVKSQHAVVVLTLGNVNADKGYILWSNFRSTSHRNLPSDPLVDGQGSLS